MKHALLYDDDPNDLLRVEEYARARRRELLGNSNPPGGTAAAPAPPASKPSPAELVWNNVTPGLRSQEILKALPDDPARAMTPSDLAPLLDPDARGKQLKKGSVRAAILNIRRVEKRLKNEGRINRAVVQSKWSDADGANRNYVLPEDRAVIATL